MVKLLWVGDLHLRGTNPRNRKDDYAAAVKTKLWEVFKIASDNQVAAILEAGDTWDRPEVSTGVLLDFADVLAESPVPIYTTAGNHDIYGYNLSTYRRTSLALLERLVPNFHVINDPSEPVMFTTEPVQVSFTPYSGRIDHDGYGYSPEGLAAETTGLFKIHVAHGMLLDHTPPFDRFTLVQEVETTADLVLTGHDHIGYGLFKRKDGKTFLNCGSLTRLSASVSEIERTIQVALISVENGQCDIQLIPLATAKPGIEVLDRSHIEAEQKRQYAMESFSTLVQSGTGEKVLVDIDSIVSAIADQENMAPEIVRLTLEKINEQRVNV